MDSGYFDDDIIEAIESAVCQYLIKGKEYPTLASQVTAPSISLYRQQIKTFRLKYIFLAGKIIRTARSMIMKLSERYPYREMYEQSFA